MSERKPAVNRPVKPGSFYCLDESQASWVVEIVKRKIVELPEFESINNIVAWSRDPVPDADPEQFRPALEPCPICHRDAQVDKAKNGAWEACCSLNLGHLFLSCATEAMCWLVWNAAAKAERESKEADAR